MMRPITHRLFKSPQSEEPRFNYPEFCILVFGLGALLVTGLQHIVSSFA